MATVISRLRATTAVWSTQTVQAGVVGVDTTGNHLRLFDGVTVGGHIIPNQARVATMIADSENGILSAIKELETPGLIYQFADGTAAPVVIPAESYLSLVGGVVSGKQVLVLDSDALTLNTSNGIVGGGVFNNTLSISADNTIARVADVVPNTRQVIAGAGLVGGGSLAQNRTLSLANLPTPVTITGNYVRLATDSVILCAGTSDIVVTLGVGNFAGDSVTLINKVAFAVSLPSGIPALPAVVDSVVTYVWSGSAWVVTSRLNRSVGAALAQADSAQAALTAQGVVATPEQINVLDGRLVTGNSFLLRENSNLSPAAENFNAVQWVKTSPVPGVAYAFTTGRDERGEFADVRLFGTSTTAATLAVFNASELVNIINGQTYTASCVIERVGGAWTGIASVMSNLVSWTSANAYIAQTNDIKAAPLTGPINFAATRAFTGATESKAALQISVNIALNTAFDITLRIRGLQLDLGSARRNYRYLPTVVGISTDQFSSLLGGGSLGNNLSLSVNKPTRNYEQPLNFSVNGGQNASQIQIPTERQMVSLYAYNAMLSPAIVFRYPYAEGIIGSQQGFVYAPLGEIGAGGKQVPLGWGLENLRGKELIISFNEVSLSGTDNILLQYVDDNGAGTGGLKAGVTYDSAAQVITNGVLPAVTTSTAGILIPTSVAAEVCNGVLVITPANITDNRDVNGQRFFARGSFRIGARLVTTLTRITQTFGDQGSLLRIRSSGTNTFDGSSFIEVSKGTRPPNLP